MTSKEEVHDGIDLYSITMGSGNKGKIISNYQQNGYQSWVALGQLYELLDLNPSLAKSQCYLD